MRSARIKACIVLHWKLDRNKPAPLDAYIHIQYCTCAVCTVRICVSIFGNTATVIVHPFALARGWNNRLWLIPKNKNSTLPLQYI